VRAIRHFNEKYLFRQIGFILPPQSMTVTFLGTGTSQGVPVIACNCNVCRSADARDRRLRSSVMISQRGHNVVIDTGPDFRYQMLRENVKALSGIVFTHEHKDHIAGLDEVRAFNYFNQWKAQVYCTAAVEKAIKREFAYAFEETKYPGVPQIDLNLIDDQPFSVEGIRFIPIQLMHMYMPVFGYRIGNFTYITDANYIAESEIEKVKGSEILVLNALRREKHPSHFNLEEAVQMAQKIGARETYFTHISHQLGEHVQVEKELPDGMFIAYDGLKLEVNK
jgi:phosphoribosyl 1,2-cyclic phosphate phosphodiesterase